MGKYYLGTGNQQINFQVVDSTGVISDLNLSGLYLSITGKAADADKLDNFDSSFFRNAQNLTGIYTGQISGSIGNADTLDGLDSSYFLNGANITGTVSLSGTFTGYYTGAFSGTITHTDSITFHTGLGINPDPAELTWNDDVGTMQLGLQGGNIDLRVGLQNYEYVTNRNASTLSKGSVVYISGAQGNRPAVALALANADSTSAVTFGILAEDIASMANGYAITNGLLTNLNTTGFAEGAALYLSPTVSGAVISSKPQAPSHSVLVGFCVRSHASAGEILVKIQNGVELDELHDVRITSAQNNDIIRYNAPSGVWFNSNTLALNGTGSHYISGDLGIGTSSPSAKLHIFGADKRQIITSTTDNAALVLGQWDGATNRIESSTRKLLITSYANGISLGINGSENVHVSTSGYLGVGTTSPQFKLDVNGIASIAQSYYLNKGFADGVEEYLIRGSAGSWNGFISYTPSSSTANRGFKFGAWDNGGNRNDWVSIWNGNVGIGTTAPSQKLHVASGNINLDTNQYLTWNGNANNGITWDTAAIRINIAGSLRARFDSGGTTLGVDAIGSNKLNVSGNVSVGSGYVNTVAPTDGMIVQGNVGIGTASPSQKLEVTGNIKLTNGGYIYGDGANAQLHLSNAMGSQLIYGSVAVRALAASVKIVATSEEISLQNNGGTIWMTAGGNVGIGTTSPTEKFYVNGGNAAIEYVTGSVTYTPSALNTSPRLTLIGQYSTTDTYNLIRYWSGGSHDWSAGTVTRSSGVADYIFQSYNGSAYGERVRITAAGNVGIGTASPGAKFDVRGAGGTITQNTTTSSLMTSSVTAGSSGTLVGGNDAMTLVLSSENTAAQGVGGVLGFGAKYNTTINEIATVAAILGAKESSSSGVESGYLAFGTRKQGLFIAERMRITSDGNVGIGTTTPYDKLEVAGGIAATGYTTGNASQAHATLIGVNGGTSYLQAVDWGAEYKPLVIEGKTISLQTGTGSTSSRFYIDNIGNVGIGTTSPVANLHIYRGVNSTVATLGEVASYSTVKIGKFRADQDNSLYIGNAGSFCSFLQGANDAGSNAMHILINPFGGNVGIGTTNPNYKLHVVGDARIGTNGQRVYLFDDGNAHIHSSSGPLWLNAEDSSGIYINNQTNGSVYLTNGTGRVGIGTTSPTEMLQVAGSANIDGSINFLRGSGEYSTYIKANDYVDGGYSGSTLRYWIELGSKGGTHIVLNTDGSAAAAENAYDHFTIWQYTNGSGAIAAGARKFWITNTGRVNFIDSTWHKSSDGIERIHFGTNGSTFYKGGGSGIIHTFRNASDVDILTLSNAKDAVFAGNITVAGNLTINGTTTTVNSTVTTVDDPIITLGGDTAPTVDDNKDRGVEFRWHNGSAAKVGFFGFDDSTGYFTFIPDATNSSEVFSGTQGDIQAANFRGTLIGSLSNALTAGSYLTGSPTSSYNGSVATTFNVDATSANTASKVVARDASGNFSAGVITGTRLEARNSGTTQIYIDSTNNGSKEIVFQNNGATTGYLWQASTYLGLGGGSGSNSLFVTTSNGNVGVGTASPSYKLDINGSVRTNDWYYVESSGFGMYNNANAMWWASHASGSYSLSSNTTFSGIKLYSGGSVNTWRGHFYGDSSGQGFLNSSGNWQFIVNSSGNVGIGITIPLAKLHLYSDDTNVMLSMDGSGAPYMRFLKSGTATGYIGTAGAFSYGGNTDLGIRADNSLYVTSLGGSQYFNAGAVANILVIASTGNVGIGTTSPSAKLDVSGDSVQNVGLVRFTNNYASGNVYYPTASFIQTRANHSYGIVSEFRTNTAADNDRPSILFYAAQAAHSWQVGQVTSGWGTNDNFGIGYRASNTPGSFSAWPTNYFTITTGGNVGIGVTGPSYKLDVAGAGSGNVGVRLTPDHGRVRFHGYDILGYNTQNIWMISNDPTNIFTLGTSWDWDYSCDLRYTPGTAGAVAGALLIGQINKNSATFTHGYTALYTNGAEKVRLTKYGTLLVGDNIDFNGGAWWNNGNAVLGKNGTDKVVIGYLGSSTLGAMIGAHNSAMTAWAGMNINGTSISFRIAEATKAVLDANGAFIQGGGTGRSTYGTTVVLNRAATFAANSDIGDGERFLSIVNENNTTNAMATLGFRINPNGGNANAMLDMKFVNTGATSTSKLHYSFNHGGSWADRLTIQSDGNVGIGTTSPGYKLDVSGDARVTGSIRISTANTTGNGIIFADDGDIVDLNDAYCSMRISYGLRIYSQGGGGTTQFQFATSQSGAPTYLNAGNVGIGLTTPSEKLHIAGTVRIDGTTNGLRIFKDGGAAVTSTLYLANSGNTRAYNWQLNSSGDGLDFFTYDGNAWAYKITYLANGNVGIGTQAPSYKLEVNGSFAATTKSFVIPHPTKEGKKLRYGSLEGPENGVYIRGKTTSKVIELPDYWTKLVDPDSITVQLTPIGSHQKLYVEKIEDNKVYIANENLLAKNINCFFYILAERADVEKLQVEIDA